MFNSLTERFDNIFRKLKGHGKLSEQNIKESMREVRRALLEADVNFKIIKEFINNVSRKAVGTEVMKSLTPGHQVVKIVHAELIELMGSESFKVRLHDNKKNKIMLVGLQGSGKTTTCAKLASKFRKNSINPALVACDIYRPAAIHQLQVLGKQLSLPVIADEKSKNVLKIAKKAIKETEKSDENLLIFDTAGRLHIDEKLMKELRDLKKFLKPDYIFFVADAMTGQDAVNVAKEFNEQLEFDGVILTKMDSDARGGAALSIKAVTGKPLVFVGTGEKISELEEFHPDRMANRILGMGDVLSLIEKAEQTINTEEAEKLAEKLKKNQFTFTDFLSQLQQLQKMGPMDQLLGMMPGMNNKALKGLKVDEKDIKHIEAIIYSMTRTEREKPTIINGSRRHRIAKGSGTSIQEVNRLIKQFDQMKKMMKKFNNPKAFKGGMLPF
ncbi:MAG: signal recognition particle protein [Candidatus Cloacimonetes bacterium]|nr:signal recognition particle protein [Candidatus Cloacimonadota bacterium]MCF7813259.1 signal recognition particle protein [Candidatus Cloacimonadota bacterium]MCF7867458.1 signal recognition particle protein [Candidatus Cloacimonadota bacterium]MCF7882910.1 signal recognition particle protein [Candidatus Cloacimonadota bacterium]